MALVLADLVEETTTTSGTGTLSLAGKTSRGRTFVEGIGSGNDTIYGLKSSDGNFEVAYGVVTDGSPDTLTRGTLIASSTGSRLDLPAGTHTVFCTFSASLLDTTITPSISTGALELDLDGHRATYAIVNFNGNINANGVTISNPPVSGHVVIQVALTRASANGYTCPQTAWNGLPGTVLFQTEYSLFEDTSPNIITLETFNYNSTSTVWYAYLNSAITPAGIGAALAAEGVTNGNSHDHSGGDGAQIDHGGLAGLSDDDHTQYSLVNGTRAFSAKVSYASHPTFSSDTEITDKKYVDDAITSSAYTDEKAQDAVGTALTDSTSIDFTYNDAAGTITAAAIFGTTSGTVCQGNDSRLSDARTPSAHTTSHKHGGSDEVATATAAANAIPKAGSGGTLATGWIPDLSATYATAAKGVTNGDSHDHSGGDGAQIAYSSLSGTPTLGGAAALNVGTATGTVAAGDDSRFTEAVALSRLSQSGADVGDVPKWNGAAWVPAVESGGTGESGEIEILLDSFVSDGLTAVSLDISSIALRVGTL